MTTPRKVPTACLTALTLMVCGLVSARAQGPMPLQDRQLDGVTAGAAIVYGTSDAQATGALALTGTTANSFVVAEPSPYKGQPNLGPTAGVSEGTATAVGTNVVLQGNPPPSSTTSVTTSGSATGNQIITSTVNQTIHGVGGVTFQAGWTFVYGAWVGL